ncbi:MAG: exodeoxyribonuclease V subunit gamma [Lautropia sp.]|nr:exodeoxyribonuclease V subunit gamma [Lautropia sp.]
MNQHDISPGFIIIHGNHSETLRDLLGEWMRAYPLAPLENEVILVQSNGIAQWLTLSLASDPSAGEGGQGIAAALDMQLPSRFIWQVYRQVLGEVQVPLRSPFGKDLLLWRLMRLLPDVIEQPVFAPLARFLKDDPLLRRRHQLAERVADLYDQYQVYRADWLEDWASGKDQLRLQRQGTVSMATDQSFENVRWQPVLWRLLLEDAGEEGWRNRAHIHARFMEACRDMNRPRPSSLARRVFVFGISAMPRQALDVLAVLGRWSQVLICLQNPCRHYWADIVPERTLLSASSFRHAPKVVDGKAVLKRLPGIDHGHALLAAWGRQGRDLIAMLAEHDDLEQSESRLGDISRRADVFVDLPADTLLSQIQQDILDLDPLTATRQRWPAVDAQQDISIRFHVCHSPQREVEVLHDQLLTAFAADASLQPGNVLVMVPDIQRFAPHIEAVFGLYSADDPHFIPFSIADRSSRAQEPLLRAVEFLLSLPMARITASDVMDLLDVSAVQRRFDIDITELPTLKQWIERSGIRWGLNKGQRASLGLGESVDANTWHFGMQRMLLGYAVGGGGSWAGIEPLDDVSGLDAPLVGKMMALIDALTHAWTVLSRQATPAEWVVSLRAMLSSFMLPANDHEAWLLMQLEDALHQWLQDCEETCMRAPLPLSVVSEHWLSSLDDDGLTKRFFAGAVTFATLMPMRAIPFRHVCLLGMNDKEFPREKSAADFDLMSADYRPGDRSRREDDHYLFLEALLSARERLYISWEGRSALDNAYKPPSVLVAQLRDHLRAGWRLSGAERSGRDALLERLTTVHRLQPFSRAYYEQPAGQPDLLLPPGDGLFSHVQAWRRSLQALDSSCAEPAMTEHNDLADMPAKGMTVQSEVTASNLCLSPMQPVSLLDLDTLGSFIAHPVRKFFHCQLNINLGTGDEEADDNEPFSVGGLQNWKIRDELLACQKHALQQGRSTGEALEESLAALLRTGLMPVGGFGQLAAQNLGEPARSVFDAYVRDLENAPSALPDQIVSLDEVVFKDQPLILLPAVTGRIDQLRRTAEGGRRRVLLTASNLINRRPNNQGKYHYGKLLPHWVIHVAAHLTGESLTTVVHSFNGVVTISPIADDMAGDIWRNLLLAWYEGMRRPLPFAVQSAAAWHFERARLDGQAEADAFAPAEWHIVESGDTRGVYEGDGFWEKGERSDDPHLQRAFATFQSLWSEGEFDLWVSRLMSPLIHHVKQSSAGSGE